MTGLPTGRVLTPQMADFDTFLKLELKLEDLQLPLVRKPLPLCCFFGLFSLSCALISLPNLLSLNPFAKFRARQA
ncbi:hypothetical protein HPB52_021951 [Rhipicephalus sanguineus]|uniref:Uncharacterized protein n=1 Tax=Rhipicephalus sanguineus TaxID=34632 RepID=A0A9D4T4R9_RHISA|nr:hypothetical protein HPB52_021951 [Rhipicephalus sanguineus]